MKKILIASAIALVATTASALEVKVHAVEDNLVIISKEEDLQEGDHVFIKYLVND